MTSMKLMFEGDCKRSPTAPQTLREATQEAAQLFQLNDLCLINPDTNAQFTEDQYREMLRQSQRAGASVIRINVARAQPRVAQAAVTVPLFPQCSSCLKHLTGLEAVFQLPCKHALCGKCVESRTVGPRNVVCSIDKSSGEATLNLRLPALLQALRAKVDSFPAPLSPALLSALQPQADAVFSGVNVALVPCGFLIFGDCPNPEVCRYEHTSKAKVLARTLKEKAMNESISAAPIRPPVEPPAVLPSPLEKSLPPQRDTQEESKAPIPFVPPPLQGLPSQPLTLENVELAQSCVMAPQPAQQILPQHLLSHIQQSVHESLQALNSLRVSQLTMFSATCSICGRSPILGHMYKCSECDLVLCPECEELSDHPHPLYKVKKPVQQVPAEPDLDPRDRELQDKVKAMGFKDEAAIRAALRISGRDLNAIVSTLLFTR